MRRLIWVPAVLAVVAGVWLFGMGGLARVAAMAAEGQREVQNAMAGALRALRAGQPDALFTLWSLCFAYGFFHAAGPGHGKLVIGGYGLGRRVPMLRLSALAVASSLAQAATAVIMVMAGILVLGWSRETMQGLADKSLNTLSNALIAGIGLWLLWRGARALWRLRSVPEPVADVAVADFGGAGNLHGLGQVMPDHPAKGNGGVCEVCGHAHGPTMEQVAEVKSLRDAAVIIGAIAARPCTGALFLLVLTWRLDLLWAGIAGAFVMAVGTATVTVLVAIASVGLRESALMQVASGTATLRFLSALEVLAGAIILAIALQLLLR
jgi:ABC-type nickel/cobalt efflux system permease component RcnA